MNAMTPTHTPDAADRLREAFEQGMPMVHGISPEEARALVREYVHVPRTSRTPRQAGQLAAIERRRKAAKAARLARRASRKG